MSIWLGTLGLLTFHKMRSPSPPMAMRGPWRSTPPPSNASRASSAAGFGLGLSLWLIVDKRVGDCGVAWKSGAMSMRLTPRAGRSLADTCISASTFSSTASAWAPMKERPPSVVIGEKDSSTSDTPSLTRKMRRPTAASATKAKEPWTTTSRGSVNVAAEGTRWAQFANDPALAVKQLSLLTSSSMRGLVWAAT
jgi:hypothetical protein